jgi:hypothetical protein
MRRAYYLGSENVNENFTDLQRSSILVKRNVDTFQRIAGRAFGIDHDKPMANLEN